MSETPAWMKDVPDEPAAPVDIDTSVGHPARVWDYWLGGKDHFPADREVGEHILAAMPQLAVMARADREFLGRSVRYMAEEEGIRQFLDIGTGIPTANNTHQVAQAVAPESRIVYVDNDPIVLVHARALLTSTSDGVTDYIDGDLREPDKILEGAAKTLDFDQPIAVMLLGILEFVPDHEQAYGIVSQLMDAVPSGSFLAIAHSTNEIETEAMDEAARRWNEGGSTPLTLRNRAELSRFFDGLELLEPGVGSCSLWRPDEDTSYSDREVPQFCGVGRKP
jgi:S-adenosyl methyltransferase